MKMYRNYFHFPFHVSPAFLYFFLLGSRPLSALSWWEPGLLDWCTRVETGCWAAALLYPGITRALLQLPPMLRERQTPTVLSFLPRHICDNAISQREDALVRSHLG